MSAREPGLVVAVLAVAVVAVEPAVRVLAEARAREPGRVVAVLAVAAVAVEPAIAADSPFA